MNFYRKYLNQISMYRLVVYVLAILVSIAIIFSFFGRLSSSPTSLVLSLGAILIPSYVVDRAFGKFLSLPTNMESSLISALILFLIVQPASSVSAGMTLVLAGVVSSASKYIVARQKKHIFNPAAFAAALLSLTGIHAVTWWIGSSVLWPFALILGISVVYKIHKLPLFWTYIVVASTLQYLLFVHAHLPLITDMKHALLASPLIFMSTIMLTEPATMPPRQNLQMLFAGIVAILYVTSPRLGPLVIYPEVALLLGNVFAYVVSPKFSVRLELKEIQRVSNRVYNYIFTPDRKFNFLPGQYMEWTLANVPYDSRGNRRTFTIASSPTEIEVHLGVKFYEPASRYKATLHSLKIGDFIQASQLAGNFTIAGVENRKLAFIAGGVGITPFRSMVKFLSDSGLHYDITILYAVRDPKEFIYADILKAGAKVGIQTIPIITDNRRHMPGIVSAKVTADLIARLIPDHQERLFFVSGSNRMVDATTDNLTKLGIPKRHISTDRFSVY